MAKRDIIEELEILEGTQVSLEGNILNVSGPKGSVAKKLILGKVSIKVENNKIILEAKKATKRELKIINTYLRIINNLMKGVTEGFTYKLKIAHSHFPMKVNFNNGILEVRNFFGEKHPRTLKIPEDVSLKIQGDIIILEGVDKEKVGNVAGRIEKLTSRSGFDRRVFQDGIYIIEKAGKPVLRTK